MRLGCTGDSCHSLLLSLFSCHLFVMLNSFGSAKQASRKMHQLPSVVVKFAFHTALVMCFSQIFNNLSLFNKNDCTQISLFLLLHFFFFFSVFLLSWTLLQLFWRDGMYMGCRDSTFCFLFLPTKMAILRVEKQNI